MTPSFDPSAPQTRPPLTLLELPAAAAEARSKYLAQGFLLFVGLVFLVGTFVILRWSSQALEQQSVLWETRLTQAAFADASHISGQIESRLAPWERLAATDAIKLYIMQAADPDFPGRDSARAYVENALVLAAERDGIAGDAAARSRVPVNTRSAAPVMGAGVMLVSADQTPLLSIGNASVLSGANVSAKRADGGARVVGPYAGLRGEGTYLSFIVPITQVQSSNLVAELHITYALGEAFLPPGALPQDDLQGSSFALINSVSDHVLMPSLMDGERVPVVRSAPGFDGDSRYRWAAATQQSGAAKTTSAGDVSFLVSARSVAGTQWVVVRSVPEDQALALVKRQTWVWLLLSFLALGLSCGLILLSWKRGVAHKADAISAARETANQALSDANSFLNTLADTQPSALLVQDVDGRVVFGNAAAQSLTDLDQGARIEGQTLGALFGLEDARPLERAAESARAARRVVTASLRLGREPALRHGRITAAPLGGDLEDGRVVLTFDDLTDVIRLRAKREAALRQLIAVLMGLIDARDPYSAAHSRSVASLSRKVGVALDYTDDQLRDLEMAALLSNAGKVLVPRSVLTKPGALSAAELREVRAALAKTSTLLGEVDFDGRVSAILAAAETGTATDDADVQAATIIRAANALVGMISPRAHRSALSLDEALESVKDQHDDKQVLSTIDYVARTQWAPKQA